ncbi:MAG TPA: hypothetical protein VFY81_09645 [Gammaproteobacteria bacterium]|nr:hypothetical protein [Gammaproteobacteria bacterium]
METIRPFENEAESLQIDELTVENRLDRISIYGNVDITRDKAGLERARQLQRLLNDTLKVLEGEELPEAVATKPSSQVPNPFQ